MPTSLLDHLLARETFDARDLADRFPPRVTDPNKERVFRIGASVRRRSSDRLEVTRWDAAPLPPQVPRLEASRLRAEAGFFRYDPADDPGHVAWHLNFADYRLFVAYGSGLLAQDEMQVAEHPALASLLEALHALRIPGLEPYTRGDAGPTPVLVRGVERRCAIDTAPDPAAGRPQGIYGHRFAKASAAVIERAARPIDPPTVSNIIALQAPAGGRGRYSREEIEDILVTATTGFAAARAESGGAPAAIHTGQWGTGAYGGNRLLMALLQIAAASLAGVERLVYHVGDPGGRAPFDEAVRTLGELLSRGAPTEALVSAVLGLGLEWGVSDGN